MKVKKSTKKVASPPPDAAKLIEEITSATDDNLVIVLDSFRIWRYPRGDLHGWIPIIDRFDDILAQAIKEYGLTQIQTNDFTPKTKELILQVLRVEKILFENCTNRKLFASYDRLCDLLLTNDLDVLHATLSLLLRPLQQYASLAPMEKSIARDISARLVTLARGSDGLRSHNLDLKTLASEEEITRPEGINQLPVSFYPTQIDGKSPKLGPTTLTMELENSTVSGSSDQVMAIAEANHMSVNDQLETLNKARWIASLNDVESRRKLLASRLVAIAALWFFATEDSSHWLYEPNLLSQMTDLLAEGIDDDIQAGALLAFDACARHRSKSAELLTTLGANLSHGPLLSLFRRVSQKLDNGHEVLHDIVDALLGLVAFICVTPNYNHVLSGAGIVPLLLDMCKASVERRDSYVPRAAGLLEAFINSMNFAPMIGQIVEAAHVEAEHNLTLQKPAPSPTVSQDTITVYINAPLKALLRSLHRVMHSGIEGSRTLIDSKLTQSLNLVFKNPDVFGPKVYAQSISILASFVHNEPTSLTTLQEMSLPQNLFERFETSVPNSQDVLAVAISALGAACLNTAGLDWVKAHPNIIRRMVSAATELDDTPGSEDIQHLGGHFDELARHHPALRGIIVDHASACLTAAYNAAKEAEPSEDVKDQFDWNTIHKPVPDVHPVFQRFTKVAKLWEGMLGSSTISKEFSGTSIQLLTDICNVPMRPINFSTTELRTIISRIFRLLVQYDHIKTLKHLIDVVRKELNQIEPFWKMNPDSTATSSPAECWANRGDATQASAHASDAEQPESLRGLPPMILKLSWLGECLNNMSWSNSRSASSAVTYLANTPEAVSVISDVAALHRYAFRAVARINSDSKSTSTFLGALAGLDDTSDTWPKSGARFLSMRVHITITKLFKSAIRLLQHRRGHDENYSRHATHLAAVISKDMVRHIEALPHNEDRAAIGLTAMLLFDDRGPEGRVNLLLFAQFQKQGGIIALRDAAHRVLDRMDQASEEQRPAAFAAVRMAMLVISALIGPSSASESGQANAASVDPHAMVSQLRLDLGPTVHRVWMASWLLKAPTAIIKSSTKAMLTIMEGKSELPPNNGLDVTRGSASIVAELIGRAPPPHELPRARPVASPDRISQLVDMGFGPRAAESALLRSRNNVAAATDLLLTMPHLFNEDEPPNAVEGAQHNEGDAAPSAGEAGVEGSAPSLRVGEPEAAAHEAAEGGPQAEIANGPAQTDDIPAESAAPGAPVIPQGQEVTDAMDVDQILQQAVNASILARTSDPEPPIDREAHRKALHAQVDDLRAKYKDDIVPRALAILDHADELVFDLLPAFPTGDEGLLRLLNHTLEAIINQAEDSERIINARLRMLAIFMRGASGLNIDAKVQQLAVDIITPLQMDSPRPKWTVSMLVFAEVVFAAAENITSAKIGDEPAEVMVPTETLDAIAPELSVSLNLILSDPEATRDELISALRLLVSLSRRHEDLVPLQSLLEPFKKADAKLNGLQPYISMIFRHAFEDADSLTNAMRREIRSYLGRNKVTDVNHFVKQLRQAACRDPALFIQAVEKECSLLDLTPSQSVYHIRALEETTVKTAASDVFQADDASGLTSVMDLLVAELDGLADTSAVYSGLIASLITEIVGSYVAPKRMFIAALRRKSAKGGLASVVNDMVCRVHLTDLTAAPSDTKDPTDSSRRVMLSSWVTSLLVALSTEPGAELKDDVEQITTARKALLEVLAKAIKENPSLDPNAYYGRLWALGELVQRLLNPSPAEKTSSQSNIQVARIMLEKNFVSILTAAAGEIDLNYPGVKVVLGSLLKALDQLTRISIKWSRTEKSTTKTAVDVEEDLDETDDSSMSDDIDMDIDDEEQQAPDLYRNSALGMLDMMDEDSDMDDEGDEEDDEMMEAFEEELDAMDDEGSGTEPSSEEDGSDGDGEEWTDEEMDPDDMDEDDDEDMPQVVIGEPDPAIGDWNDDGIDDEDEDGVMGPGGDMLGMGYDGDEAEDEEGMWDVEGDEDEDPDMDDLDEAEDMDEEDYDEVDMIDAPHSSLMEPVEPAGHWGWGTTGDADSGTSRRHRGEQAASALFGLSGQPSASGIPVQPSVAGGGPAQPALLAPPVADSRRRDVATTRDELYAALEGMGGPQAVRLLESLLHRSDRTGPDAVRISFAQGQNGVLDVSVGNRSFSVPRTHQPVEPTTEDLIAGSAPRPSMDRWSEESKLTPIISPEYFARFVQHLINRLLPEAKKRAAEEEIKRKKAEEEKASADERKKAQDAKKKEEEDVKKAEEDRQNAEAAQRRVEEAEAAAGIALPESRLSPIPPVVSDADVVADTSGDVEMVDVPALSAPAGAPVEVEPAAETLARTMVQIRGQEIDITDLGIDLEFLQALPEDMQADVIEQRMREVNPRGRTAQNDAPINDDAISPEFLNALPPDIRREVLAQQAAERQGGDRQARGPSTIPMPFGLNGLPNVSGFLASLDEELRDVIGTTGPSVRKPKRDMEPKPSANRESIQLLEKPGIASLARLLFFQDSFKKERLFRVLANLCENSTSRSDLLNLLLSVLQDGSGDLPNVDRSFQQMSIKNLTTPKSTPKAKVAESPAPFAATNLFTHLRTDNIPTFIAQRCLEALTHILSTNSQAVNFFLTEHEQGVGLRKVPKKGKGKEKVLPQIKFPIVILLGLLDRSSLLTAPGIMESLTALLATVTRPLSTLKADLAKAEAAQASAAKGDTAKSTTESAAPAVEGQAGQDGNKKADKKDVKTQNAAKPEAPPTPRFPQIPNAILKLVVNCLTTGECSSRTFSQALIVLQNLCCIPEAQKTILQELQERSQRLGQEIQVELHNLTAALTDPGFETGNPALTVFSSPSSNQAQLLRLLKTIEYLHLNKVDSDPPGDVMTESEQAVATIYQSFDFAPLWADLQRCLTQVEERQDTKQISLVILPLVESLMVICKYQRRPSREVRSPSVPPASAVDTGDLFLSFTTHHRKVLNEIVRNNPALLSGSFSLLIHNPKVLEFDNKRQWFFQKLKRKKDQPVPSGTLSLNVRRQYVFQDSFDALRHKSGAEIKYGKIGVKFIHEDGIDAGGVTREWYSVLAQQIFDPNFALFEPCAADKQTYQPNKFSSFNGEHLAYFKFIGRIIGKAVYDGRLLDAYFNRAFYKQILGKSVDIRDLESIDPEFHKSLQWMLDNDITGVIDSEFTIEDDQFGETKIVELKEGGAAIPVTEENKEEYVRLVVSYRLDNSIKDQVKAFLDGFYDIIPRKLIQIFEPDQLELLISGMSTIDVDELKNATQMSGWKSSDVEIGWFWRALRSFSQEERSRFLMFVTSSSRVPLGGFTQLQGSSGVQAFQIQKLFGKEGGLPQASTCFNLLLLPSYESYEQLRERLLFAVTETGGFGKA